MPKTTVFTLGVTYQRMLLALIAANEWYLCT